MVRSIVGSGPPRLITFILEPRKAPEGPHLAPLVVRLPVVVPVVIGEGPLPQDAYEASRRRLLCSSLPLNRRPRDGTRPSLNARRMPRPKPACVDFA